MYVYTYTELAQGEPCKGVIFKSSLINLGIKIIRKCLLRILLRLFFYIIIKGELPRSLLSKVNSVNDILYLT